MCLSLPVSARQVSPQPYALCRSGGMRVHATARRMHIRLRVAVLRIPPRSASVCSACGGETCRPWHLGCSSRLREVSASLPLPASTLPSPSRRFAPRCFVGRIRPPRLAACSAAHATNRVAACRSARRSTPRVASSASVRCVLFAPFCAASPSAAPLSFRCEPKSRKLSRLIPARRFCYNSRCSAGNCGICSLTYRLVVSQADGRHGEK